MMDVSNMLAEEGSSVMQHQQEQNHTHQYPTRRSMSANSGLMTGDATPQSPAPAAGRPRNVAFELIFEGAPKARGRLSLRVQIWPHDTTESIVTTVKNFFGLYDGVNQGISFEDEHGNTIIASYENFVNGMTAHVRVIDVPHPAQYGYGGSPQHLHEDGPMLPPQPAQILNYGGHLETRNLSPQFQGRPLLLPTKPRSRATKSQSSSFQAGLDELNSDTHNGYSSSDGGAGSVSSSRRARSEQLASAEISVDNIVEGGRRKRAKFESSVCVPNSLVDS
jgi:hypothetical protein